MSESTFQLIQELLKTLGLPLAGLLIVLYTGHKRMWVWGWQYNDVIMDRDKWRDIGLRSLMALKEGTTEKTRATNEPIV